MEVQPDDARAPAGGPLRGVDRGHAFAEGIPKHEGVPPELASGCIVASHVEQRSESCRDGDPGAEEPVQTRSQENRTSADHRTRGDVT
jgi:hypothetical protein